MTNALQKNVNTCCWTRADVWFACGTEKKINMSNNYVDMLTLAVGKVKRASVSKTT